MKERKEGRKERMKEGRRGLNECLTTPQHENYIGYWVSDKYTSIKGYFDLKL